MRRVVLVDCYVDEQGGRAFFLPWLAGVEVIAVDAVRQPEALPERGFDGVLITGSRASVNEPEPWMEVVATWLRAVVARDMPVLGCCFGHQLLAWSLVGPRAVERAPVPEVGYLPVRRLQPDPLLDALGDGFAPFISHEDQVRPVPEIEVLARSEACAVQAMRLPGRRAWGVQFHVEYPEHEQLRILRYRAERHPELGLNPERLLAEAPHMGAQARALFSGFLAMDAPDSPPQSRG